MSEDRSMFDDSESEDVDNLVTLKQRQQMLDMLQRGYHTFEVLTYALHNGIEFHYGDVVSLMVRLKKFEPEMYYGIHAAQQKRREKIYKELRKAEKLPEMITLEVDSDDV